MSMTTQPAGVYEPQWTVADRLRRIRRDTGLSQEEFAAQIDVKVGRYQAWESGRNNPPMNDFIATAKRIQMAFGVKVEWTLGLETTNTPGPDGTEGEWRARRDSNPKPSDCESAQVIALQQRRRAGTLPEAVPA